jgi:hypothetical protein
MMPSWLDMFRKKLGDERFDGCFDSCQWGATEAMLEMVTAIWQDPMRRLKEWGVMQSMTSKIS